MYSKSVVFTFYTALSLIVLTLATKVIVEQKLFLTDMVFNFFFEKWLQNKLMGSLLIC